MRCDVCVCMCVRSDICTTVAFVVVQLRLLFLQLRVQVGTGGGWHARVVMLAGLGGGGGPAGGGGGSLCPSSLLAAWAVAAALHGTALNRNAMPSLTASQGVPLTLRMEMLEQRWVFLLGFGAPFTLATFSFSFFVSGGIYALLFPVVRCATTAVLFHHLHSRINSRHAPWRLVTEHHIGHGHTSTTPRWNAFVPSIVSVRRRVVSCEHALCGRTRPPPSHQTAHVPTWLSCAVLLCRVVWWFAFCLAYVV